jgi:hypothetical protein
MGMTVGHLSAAQFQTHCCNSLSTLLWLLVDGIMEGIVMDFIFLPVFVMQHLKTLLVFCEQHKGSINSSL